MKKLKVKGFTLVELLVVISIIALLLAVMIPALMKAKESGYRVICANHIQTFATANVVYSNQNNQSYVPVRYLDSNSVNRIPWVANATFRKLVEFNAYAAQENRNASGDIVATNLPRAFLCPSDTISRYNRNKYFRDGANVLLSYGYNYTDWSISNWDSWTGYPLDAGHKAGKITAASSAIAFADSVDWWFVWNGGDYRIGWNKLGQANIAAYKALTPRVDGPILYRHSEGANFGFYDGHVKYMKKEQAFVIGDRDATPTRKPGMWVGNTAIYFRGSSRGN
jgi:prepilin-type N-terminal cleavage/methylation domain-containing protein/prepilin-type processing-associated H-X9-DG protein